MHTDIITYKHTCTHACAHTNTHKHATTSRYYSGGFYVNNVQVPGSVIAQSDIFLLWKPRR
jgi:hypothetical protein